VNRPHEQISIDQMLSGLIDFRRRFRVKNWLEVYVVGAYTAIPGELAKLAKCVDYIKPDRVQLNTVTRPPAETHAVGVSPQRLAELGSIFRSPAEVIADFRRLDRRPEFIAGREDILNMLRRRPCSIDDIADGLNMHRNEAIKHLEELNAESLLAESLIAEKRYYRVADEPSV
jgi:wyosine [tRNA(Phe)-imidazoG37] synthetase (radical SAM superfamily)